MRFALPFALVLLALVLPARAIPPPDSVAATDALTIADTVRVPVQVGFRFRPTALYSPSRGLGLAGGIGLRNVGWNGSLIELGARVSQRYQSADATLYSGDPYTTPLYGFISTSVETSSRRGFYGLGPFADRGDKLYLGLTSARFDARLGWYPFGHSGLLLQPGVQLQLDRLSSFEEDDVGALDRLDAASLTNLEQSVGITRTGMTVGLEVISDTRDALVLTRRGMLLEGAADRFFALDDSGRQFNRAQVRLFGFYPLYGRRTVLIGRAVAVNVWGADNDEGPLPFYYLPALDDALLPGYPGERFAASSLVAAGAGLRFPIIDLVGRYGLDGVVLADVGNVYDDLSEQFSLAVSFDEKVTADAEGRAPLRPSLTVGLGVINLEQRRALAGVLFGLSPEGVVVTSLRVVYDFRDLRPLFR